MKSQKYDFVLVTEVKNREFETNCLLSYELRKRRYTVKIVQAWEEAFKKSRPINAVVVVSWSMYNDRTFNNISNFVVGCNKMINMQCEQLLSNGQINNNLDNQFYGIHGKAKQVAHLAWGEKSKIRLIEKFGVKPQNVRLTGDISLDFCRKEFLDFYLSKDQVCEKYSIPFGKKIYLFISSFTMVNFPKEVSKDLNFRESDMLFMETSYRSQKEVLRWFDNILNDFQEGIIIYRPHPAERGSVVLQEFEKKHENFMVIGEESVRQWIIVSDKIYSWISTSIKEVYAAGKTCEILRPYPIKSVNEMEIFNHANFVTTYEQFRANFKHNAGFPIPIEEMKLFLDIQEEPTYKRIADYFEEVIKSDQYNIVLDDSIKIIKMKKRLVSSLKTYILGLIYRCLKDNKFLTNKKIREKIDAYAYALELRKKNYFSAEEYENNIRKIDNILSKK